MNRLLMVATLLLAGSAVAQPYRPDDAADMLDPGERHLYGVVLKGGTVRHLIGHAIGDAGDLDCRVFDGEGRMVASAEDDSNECELDWLPVRTERFTIQLVNQGSGPISYRMVIR